MQIEIQEEKDQEVAVPEESYFFTAVQNKFINDKQTKETLLKWGLNETLTASSFRLNQPFEELRAQKFLQDLFNSPNVRYLVNALNYPKENVSNIKFEKLRCTETTLDIFDKLTENRIVLKDYIQGCFGDQFEGVQICNLLRETLLKEECEHYCIFNEKERNELIFRLFQLLVIGGSMNQYEDMLTPYLEWSKNLYKSLVTVRKDAHTSDIFIESFFYNIRKIDKAYEPSYNPQDVLFVVVNPNSRIVHVLSNKWVKFW